MQENILKKSQDPNNKYQRKDHKNQIARTKEKITKSKKQDPKNYI